MTPHRLYARGPTPKWLENANLLRALGVRNRAGQRYDPATSAVANYGEVLGTAISFGAEGTFDLPEGQLRAPCDVPVEIASGGLTVLGRRFDLPIKGPGLVRVRYHDDDLRVFESPNTSPGKWEESGLIVVQVRESALPVVS